MTRYIFAGIDLGDKNSVARIAIDRNSSQRFGFVNTRSGRERLFREVKRRSQEAGGAKIVMAYEASSCGFVLRDHAQANQIDCHVLAPTKMEKSVEQRKQKNDDRDAEDVLERLRGHFLAGNRLPTVWVPEITQQDDRELVRTRLAAADKQTQIKAQIQMLLKRCGLEKPSDIGSSRTVQYRKWLQALSESTGRIGAGGGSTELIIKATADNNNVFYTGVGDADPRDEQLLTGSNRSRNAFSWASYFHRFGDNTTVGLEWSNWQFKTRATFGGVPGPQGRPVLPTCSIWHWRTNSESFPNGMGRSHCGRPSQKKNHKCCCNTDLLKKHKESSVSGSPK